MAPLYGASASPGPSPRSAAGRDGSPINGRVLVRRFHPACIHMMQPRLGQGSHHRKTARWRQELSGIIPQRLYLEQEFHRTVSKQCIFGFKPLK